MSSISLFHRCSIAEYVEACVAAGVGVFCEKPLGIDITQSRALVDLVATSGVPAGVNFVFSAAPSAVELAERIKQGAIGDIVRGDLRLHFAEWPRAWHAKAQWFEAQGSGRVDPRSRVPLPLCCQPGTRTHSRSTMPS